MLSARHPEQAPLEADDTAQGKPASSSAKLIARIPLRWGKPGITAGGYAHSATQCAGRRLHRWGAQAQALPSSFRVLRDERRGHGGSSAAPPPYSLAGSGGEVLALLDALRIGRVNVRGLSIGGISGPWPGVSAGCCDALATADRRPTWRPSGSAPASRLQPGQAKCTRVGSPRQRNRPPSRDAVRSEHAAQDVVAADEVVPQGHGDVADDHRHQQPRHR